MSGARAGSALAAAAAIALGAGSGAAAAPEAGAGRPLFACRTAGGTVRISLEGDRLALRHEAGADTVTLAGTAGDGSIRYLAQRFAGMAYQLRFVDGERSYIVFSSEGNANVDARPASGLVVMQGRERVRDESCSAHAEFEADYDYSRLPPDDDAFSAL